MTLVRPTRQALATDEELLLRYRDLGDSEAFAALVHRYQTPLYHYLARYLRSTALAEEVFQATLLRVHQKCRLFAEGSCVRPWLYSIATHLAIDALRREGRQHMVRLDATSGDGEMNDGTLENLVASVVVTPLEQMEAEEQAEWTRQAVGDLPDHLRRVVLLVYFQGLKYHEAARTLQVPLGTVKSRLHKAVGMLNQAWRRSHAAD
jgi:RNA polymerase sigma-70 factor (ECF subfamily)